MDNTEWMYVKDHPDKEYLASRTKEYITSLTEGAAAKGWSVGAVDKLTAYGLLAIEGEGDHDLTVHGDCIILLSQIVNYFWLDGDALVEFAMFRYKEGDINNAWLSIDKFAKDCGCKQVVIGSSAAVSDRAFSRILKQGGYTPGSIIFTKAIA